MIRTRSPLRHAFTIIELFVVVGILTILIALMLPAVQKVREAANRAQCGNNLKQVGVALNSYQDTHRRYPMGGSKSAKNGYGTSWWVAILPMMEQDNAYKQMDLTGATNPYGHAGFGNDQNQRALGGLKPPFLFCPSSTMDKERDSTGGNGANNHFARAMYVGISGSYNSKNVINIQSWGIESFDGVLTNNSKAWMSSDITDGAGNTIMVGEQSDFSRDAAGNRADTRSDCGHSFIMSAGIVGNDPSTGYDSWGRGFNMTTVQHPLNSRDSNLAGVGGNCGQNSPLQSPHTGIVGFLFADGSVRHLNQNIDVQTLYNLANRNDGNKNVLP